MNKLASVVLGLALASLMAEGQAPKAQAGIVQGQVLSASGKPLAGVQVIANNTLLQNANVLGQSGSDGKYRLQVPGGSWQMTAQMVRQYQGKGYLIELHPDNPAAFAGSDGAVRNFSWKLSGAKPRGGFYGGFVSVYPDLTGEFIEASDIELTLTPTEALMDGSTGKVRKGKLESTAEGDALLDIPLGRYKIEARQISTGQPLQVRLRRTAQYSNSVTAVFDTPYGSNLAIYRIELEVTRQ